jgi:predicted benzoate:H+ symporter BenE
MQVLDDMRIELKLDPLLVLHTGVAYICLQLLVPMYSLLAVIVETVLLLELLTQFPLKGQQFLLPLGQHLH